MNFTKDQLENDDNEYEYSYRKKLKLPYDYTLYVEPNISFTRGNDSIHSSGLYTTTTSNGVANVVTKEDEQFLKLAKEALVATVSNISSSNHLVDPTINDLLTRLQYASSPHGNPIKKSNELTINDSGQLNIQQFYQNFPNLSNDIYKENQTIVKKNDKNTINNNINNIIIDNQSKHMTYNNNNSNNSNNSTTNTTTTATTTNNNITNTNSNSNHPNNNSQGWSFLMSPASDEKDEHEEHEETQLKVSHGIYRKFQCMSCTQTFKRSLDLKRHEKQHLIIPPSICNLCGKGFARKDALKRHRNTLTCKRNFDKKLYLDNLQFLNK